MSDARDFFSRAVAQIRIYLLTGDKAAKDRYKELSDASEKAADAIKQQTSLMTGSQRSALVTYNKAREEFTPLAAKVFALRDAPDWNAPVHILRTEAGPQAAKIIDILEGRRGPDGKRSDGLKPNQVTLLDRDSKALADSINTLEIVLVLLLGLGLALAALIAFITARAIIVPIRLMTDAMGQLASGDTNAIIPAIGRADEIGEMANAVQVFKSNMIETERLQNEQVQIEQRSVAERKQSMHQLADSFEAAVGGIINTVSSASTELEASAGTLTQTADRTQQLSTMAASASEEASINVQSVASATEELSSSVTEIARQVQESSKIASEAVRQAEHNDERINALSQAAGRIGDVVKLITGIAEQTNLLALNTTIEAARAEKPVADLPSSPLKSKRLPRRPPKPRMRSPTRLTKCRPRPRNRSARSRKSAPPFRGFRASQHRSRARWRSKRSPARSAVTLIDATSSIVTFCHQLRRISSGAP